MKTVSINFELNGKTWNLQARGGNGNPTLYNLSVPKLTPRGGSEVNAKIMLEHLTENINMAQSDALDLILGLNFELN